jgi:putative NIF3 family GTP cyclohydrolase 1 type 2
MFVEGGLHPEQIKALRRMSLQRRLDLTLAAIESAPELRKAMIRVEHPEWSTDQVERALRAEVRNAER